jgi:dTDP-4-dehydrorhamnose 3,5-epimerase
LSAKLIKPKRFGDDRGWFAETYNRQVYLEFGVTAQFCQDNHAFSAPPWVLRGLHFQRPPRAQARLIRCVRGAIWDVLVDLRRGSPTFGRWVATKLSADNGLQVFAPEGFAHGYLTLAPATEVEYKVTDFYAPECEGGVIWNDETLRLPWPLGGAEPVISERDARLGSLAAFDSPFAYDGNRLDFDAFRSPA